MHYIEFHEEKCIACDLCSGVCSLHKLGRVQPAGACIHVTRNPSEYLGGTRCSVCDMTHERECVESCPTGALVWDEAAGVVRFIEEECTRCGACVDVCPNVHLDAVDARIMICDLCDGDPLCVKWCPEGALTWGGAS
jgi:Fe-S-cluster-containing hydrogenase component 2